MRIKAFQRKQPKDYWHRWYAWRPVRTKWDADQYWVWMEKVWRLALYDGAKFVGYTYSAKLTEDELIRNERRKRLRVRIT